MPSGICALEGSICGQGDMVLATSWMRVGALALERMEVDVSQRSLLCVRRGSFASVLQGGPLASDERMAVAQGFTANEVVQLHRGLSG